MCIIHRRYEINTQITFYRFKSKLRRQFEGQHLFHSMDYCMLACVFVHIFFSLYVCTFVLVCQYKNKCSRFFWYFFSLFHSNDYYDLIHPLAIRLQIRCLFDFETRDFGAFTTIHLIILNIRIYVYLWQTTAQTSSQVKKNFKSYQIWRALKYCIQHKISYRRSYHFYNEVNLYLSNHSIHFAD